METKVIKVNPRDIKLLEVNARFMKQEEFQMLVDNIKRDGCLTQLPFCCYNEDGELEVLSGNHRVKASIEAGLEEIQVQMTEEVLTKDQRIAIQLSHNSISGQDDLDILKQLYEAIEDVNYKKYSGLDDETLKLLDEISTQGMSNPGLQFQILNIAFLPSEIKQLAKVIKEVKQECGKNKTLLARFSEYDNWLDTLDEISSAANIKNVATSILAMLEIVERHKDEIKDLWIEDADDKQWVPISSITGKSKVRASDGRIIDKAFEKMLSKGEIKKDDMSKGLLVLAKKYLEDDKLKKQAEKEARKKVKPKQKKTGRGV